MSTTKRKPSRRTFTMTIEIEAADLDAAEDLRSEIVGAIEDNAESRTIDASAHASDLTEIPQ